VTYECNPATGALRRYWNYAISAGQPTPPAGGSSAPLASGVTTCSFTYDAAVVAQRAGLVTIHIAITRLDESVRLYHAVHVSNIP
jgi:MSHA biogenesis protein MshO